MLDDYAFFGSNQKQPLWSFFVPQQIGQGDSPQIGQSYFRPLAHLIPQISYRLFVHNVVGHHALNLVLMWLAACAVYVFLRLFSRGEKDSHDDWFAFCVAALFVAHPINGILINYITASVYSAQVVFMLGSLMCLLFYDSQNERAFQNSLFVQYVGSVMCFVLAIFCHETAVLLPVYAVIVLRLKYSWREVFGRVVPLFIVLGLYFVLRSYASPFKKSILYSLSVLDLTLAEKLATIFKLLSWYLSKLFVPYSIFLMWSTSFVKNGVAFWLAGGVALVGLLTAGVFWTIKKAPKIGKRFLVFLLWFSIGLTPIAAGAFVTPYIGGLVEPHWFVFAAIGFFALVGLLLERIEPMRRRKTVAIVVISILVILSWRNNHLWSQEIPYYQAWLKEAPQFRAVRYFLGLAYTRRGEFDKAYAEFEQSLFGRPKDWMAYLELGQIDLKRRDWERAKENIGNAYRLQSGHSGVLNAVGALLYKSGKMGESKEFFERAIASNPGNLEPYMNLGLYYKKNNEPQKAAAMYREILKINPQFVPARQALQKLTAFQPPGL